MANVIFLVVFFVGLVIMLILLFVNVSRARGSRPFRMGLASLNNSAPASDYELGPYVETVCGRFSQSLDI